MKKTFVLFLFLISVFAGEAQDLTPVKICDLPSELSESSGVETIGPDEYVSHGDSGNEPILFIYDSAGNITRRIRIGNGTNVDWEDLSKDNKGNIYIGDFGNNNSSRKDLKIYIIFDPKTFSKDTTNAGIINFIYPDQKAFPPLAAQQNFDMEAFFWFNDSLYLFSKNRSNPYSGYTKCYQLPAKTGTFTAKLIDSFYTGNGTYLNYSITSAAINRAGNKVVLLGYDKCWIFTEFSGRKFLRGKVTTYPFNSLTQKEAVYFESDYKLMITQETSPLGKAGMFRVILPQTPPAGIKKIDALQVEIEIFPNPVYESFQLLVRTKAINKNLDVMLFDSAGKKIKTWNLISNQMHELDIHEFKSGVYFIKLSGGYSKKIIKE